MIEKDFILQRFQKIIVTGGAGFIGSALIRRLLNSKNNCKIFNIDKLNYASNLLDIENSNQAKGRYIHLKVDLINNEEINKLIIKINPDIIIHLAAESHVDRSLNNPRVFVDSNIIGTFNLLEAARLNWNKLNDVNKNLFRFINISTDEVFGSLGENGLFSEDSPYSPNSPYSASKASSDHLVKAWHKSFKLPTIITNCTNNYGPYQFPDKLIPLVIVKALQKKHIPIYGDGSNIRDWLFVEDHIDAILKVCQFGNIGKSYCIGGNCEKSNLEIVNTICSLLNKYKPNADIKYESLIRHVEDRPGHDKRYGLNTDLIKKELNWVPKHNFDEALEKTVLWYLKNIHWIKSIMSETKYHGERLGL